MTNPNRPATGRVQARAHHAAAAVSLTMLALGPLAWVWSGDWRWLPTGLAGLLIALLTAAAAQPPRPRRTPAEAIVENAISDTLVKQYGFLPLTVRYGAASLAREHVEAWQAGAPDPYTFPSGTADPFTPHPTQFPNGTPDPIQPTTDTTRES